MRTLSSYKRISQLFIFLYISFFSIFSVLGQKPSNVVLENAEFLSFDKTKNAEYQVLRGNVRFRHDAAVMYCDSAYFYSEKNSLDAFGHVRMVQGDTLFVYGDVLHYNGNTKMAHLRNHVRMVNRKVVLTTDSLDYDRAANVGYYFNGGKIKDELNVLVSEHGQYFPKLKLADFKKNVVLTNPDFIIKSDTLHYNTATSVAYIFGPSNIDYKDTHIYSELGWYNTKTQSSALFKHSIVRNKDGKSLTADTIYYDKLKETGRAFRHIEMRDTVQKMTLKGNKGFYNHLTNYTLITDSALAIEHSSPDSLYLHADTLISSKDSIFNLLKAYHNVRFFRSDIQGKCDSLSYSSRDSIMYMHFEPILWSDDNQLLGDLIKVFVKNKQVDHIFVQGSAMGIMQDDSIRFNQLIGRELTGYIRNKELYKVDVSGNTQSIYYPHENDGSLVGMNRTESSFMTVYLKDKKIDKVILRPASTGKMSPIKGLTREDSFFRSFVWYDSIRPDKMEDVFIKTAPPVRKKEEKKVIHKRRLED